MKLADLVARLDLPETDVAAGAWDAALRRTRRRRTAVIGTAAALVLVVVAASALSLNGHSERPEPSGPRPTPTVTLPAEGAAPKGIDHSNTQRLLTPGLWAGLDAVTALDPDTTTNLDDDPMTEGVFATVDPDDPAVPVVLGSDGRWRRIDLPDLVLIDDGNGYTSPVIVSTAFSPDGTHLALPQPDSLVVVDLTSGSHRTYPMPGAFLHHAVWVDDSHVLVASEGGTSASVVDLHSGETSPSDFGPDTAFTDEGALSWGNDEVLDWGTQPDVPTRANNGGGLQPVPPLVKDGVAVGYMAVVHRAGGSEDPPLGTGVVAVDATTGDVLAYLPAGPGPIEAMLLGWQGDLPVIGVMDPTSTSAQPTMAIVTWDFRAAELQPLAQAFSISAAWNGPVD